MSGEEENRLTETAAVTVWCKRANHAQGRVQSRRNLNIKEGKEVQKSKRGKNIRQWEDWEAGDGDVGGLDVVATVLIKPDGQTPAYSIRPVAD